MHIEQYVPLTPPFLTIYPGLMLIHPLMFLIKWFNAEGCIITSGVSSNYILSIYSYSIGVSSDGGYNG
jgi:hypothetical protein